MKRTTFLHSIINLDSNMYQIYNDEDEFEPRITPKPASKSDCFAVPLVPEVSLIFDKPSTYNTTEHKDFVSPSSESKNLTHKRNASPSLSANGSYAAWKEQNYAWRLPTSKFNNSLTSQKVQSSRTCSVDDTAGDTLNESKERHCTFKTGVHNDSNYREQLCRDNIDNSYKRNYEMHQGNVAYIEKNRSNQAQCGNTVKHANIASTVPHVIDNYSVNGKEYSPLLYEGKLVTHNQEQRKVLNESVSEPFVQNLTINQNTLKRNEFPLPPYLGQQYPYFNMNAYPFPQLHSYSAPNIDNQETMKNLLQIINNQNEQIKSLQTQVDRLLKMQEESFKERKNCSCSSRLYQQDNQLFTNSSNDVVDPSSCVTESQNFTRNAHQNESAKDNRNENLVENENVNHNELITEAQSRKAFMEQKVSIGVMTSFEFTVQNSPFTVDIEDYEKKGGQQKKENLNMCNNVGLCDTTSESLRRYKNSFTRIPSAQLENIVEDSESYMSSSQQQSSNLNASVSIKDLEKQSPTDVRKEIDYRPASPKVCKSVPTRLNQTENNIQKRLGKSNKEDARNYETVKAPVIQKSAVDYIHVPRNNSHKGIVSSNMDQYAKLNMQKDNDSAKASNSVNSSIDCYKDYRKEGQTVTKRASCVEDSLILNGGDLRINERPPTPEPSIHVDMHEYSSDDDSEKVKRSSKVGWTFYNNVLGQVNQLLQNSRVIDDHQQNKKENQHERDESENKAVLDTVKVATLEQLKKLGISLSENPERKELNNSNKMPFDLSFYPRLDYQANMTQTTSTVNETNTSMHMKALALKYLTDEQLAELAVQRQGSASMKHLMVGNVQGTNMSFATMRYLERYQLLPGKNNMQTEDINQVQMEASPKTGARLGNPKNNPALHRFHFSQTPRTTCPSKILDISTLKQQPKLL